MGLKKFTDTSSFFKPAEHAAAVAILVEPVRLQEQRPTNFGPRDTVFGRLTIFPNQAAIDGKATPTVIESAGWDKAALVKGSVPYIGSAFAAKLDTYTTTQGKTAFKWVPLDSALEAKVEAYMEKRDASGDAPATNPWGDDEEPALGF